MAPQSRIRCVTTLRDHTLSVRRRRPVKQSVRAIRGAGRVRRRPVERPRRVRVGRPHAQGVGTVEPRVPPDAQRTHSLCAAPASSRTARRSLIDAATGAGPVRRRSVERQHRFRGVVGPDAQGLERVDRHLPPDAERAHGRSAAPASNRTARRLFADAATGAGLVRRRPVARPRRVRVGRRRAQGVGRDERLLPPDADRAHGPGAAPASSQTARSIARRRRDGRRSGASPSCRTATSSPGRTTTRSRCGKMSRRRWHVWLPCAGLRRISLDVSSPRSSRTVGLFRSASRWRGM